MTESSAREWQLVKGVLADVLSLPGDRRMAEVDRVWADNPVLAERVSELLRAMEPERDRVGRLNTALDSLLALAEAPERWIGRSLGGYRLTDVVGVGGMGVVYRAEASDGAVPVAIKVLRTPFISSTSRKRFDLERDRLSRLSHPYIALLLDDGVTPDGEPYVVMDLVEGDRIDTYADRHRLTIPERIGLLLEVGVAVTHAHERQIIHRDLKPSNILVDPSGTPKLLDFGIAKLLDPLRGGAPATLTREALAFTPGYASPEQVAGDPVSPASDVFSLGAVAYTLLAGGPPPTTVARGLRTPTKVFGSHKERRAELAAARGMSVAELEAELTGDLEQILLRACDLSEASRYASVADFSADLLRHLEATVPNS